MPSPDPTRRVLFLAWQGARAGIERHLATLIGMLPPRFQPTVAFLSTGGTIADDLAAAGVPTHVIGMRRSYDPRGGRAVASLVRGGGFDLVHDHSTMAPAAIVGLAFAGVPIVVTEHLAMSQRRLDQQLSYRLLSRFVECFIANSEATRRDLVAHGVAASRVRVVHLGLPLTPSPATIDSTRARAALGLRTPESAPLVGFVGRLEPEKGCRRFVQVAARVAAARPDATFAVVGDGSQRDLVAADVAAAGLRERLVMTGQRADIEQLYPAFDVLVSTSLRETFGLAILEAMAAGVAVAAFDVGGVRELVGSDTGELVRADDVEALAHAVIGLLRDPERRRAIGARARVVADERFTATRMVDQVVAIYDEVLAARRRR